MCLRSVPFSLACKPGFFKAYAGNHKCSICPLHSSSHDQAGTICHCDKGFYRAIQDSSTTSCTSKWKHSRLSPNSRLSEWTMVITDTDLLIFSKDIVQIHHHQIIVLSQSLFFRASVGSQEPGLVDQRHGSHPPVDASSWLGRQEGHYLQHLLPALRWKRQRQQHGPVRALRAGPALHPPAARPDWHLCGNTRLWDAR